MDYHPKPKYQKIKNLFNMSDTSSRKRATRSQMKALNNYKVTSEYDAYTGETYKDEEKPSIITTNKKPTIL
jgi:hypothetical protein